MAAISIATPPITMYLGWKLAKRDAKRQIEEWINSDIGQKAIYSIGILLGNAIKQGVGITGSGGKMKMENIIMQGIAGFIQGKLGAVVNPNPYEQPQQ